jgi:hypothetical protein
LTCYLGQRRKREREDKARHRYHRPGNGREHAPGPIGSRAKEQRVALGVLFSDA